MPIKIFIFFVAVLSILFTQAPVAYADHPGPERVVGEKYVILLSILPADGGSLNLRFLFKDGRTGKTVSDLAPVVSIKNQAGDFVLSGKAMTIKDGEAEMQYLFPQSGLFEVFLEFKDNSGTGEVYRPEKWPVWVPGRDGGESYPLGLSELAGFALAGLAAALVVWSLLANKKKA